MNFIAMSLIDRLGKWYELKEQLAELNKQEKALRLSIFEEAFPTLKEGTAYLPLNPGWKLTGVQPLSYSVDTTHLEYMRVELHKLGVSLDLLLRWKAELNVKLYKNMPDNARILFDNILMIKEGLPTIKIVPANDVEEIDKDSDVERAIKQNQQITEGIAQSYVNKVVKAVPGEDNLAPTETAETSFSSVTPDTRYAAKDSKIGDAFKTEPTEQVETPYVTVTLAPKKPRTRKAKVKE